VIDFVRDRLLLRRRETFERNSKVFRIPLVKSFTPDFLVIESASRLGGNLHSSTLIDGKVLNPSPKKKENVGFSIYAKAITPSCSSLDVFLTRTGPLYMETNICL